MTLHTQRSQRGRVAILASIAAGLVALSSVAIPAQADPLSPNTGARVSTSGDPGGARVFYVDSSSGDDSNAGTSAGSPWRSLSRVNSFDFAAGDVIAFQRGQTFSGWAWIDNAGTSSNPITITAYGSGNQPVLTNPGGWYMLALDAPYINVSNLAFTNGVVFDNADGAGINGPKYEFSGAVAVTSNGSYSRVEDSTFTDVGVGVKSYGFGSVISHNTFRDLRIAFRGPDSGSETSYGALGISANNSNIEISYNDFINCRSTDSPYGADGGAIEIEGFKHNKDNIAIHHNYSRGSQGFLEVTESYSSNVSVTYNVSDDYQQFIAWDTTNRPSGYYAANNTVIRSSDASTLFDQYYYREAGPAPESNWITIRNNIFVTSAGLSFFNFPHDHNLFGNNVDVRSVLGAGDLVADPQFVNAGARDFRLSSTSVAIDNGTTAPWSFDLAGNSVGVGQGVDIGAFEYQTPAGGGGDILNDGSFETQTSITQSSSPWYGEGDMSTGVDVGAGKAQSGSNNAWIAGSSGWGALRQNVAVDSNSTYRMTAWIRNSENFDYAYVGAKTTSEGVLNEVRYGAAGSYTKYIVTFSTGSNTTVVLHVGMWGTSGSWQMVDNVTLQKL